MPFKIKKVTSSNKTVRLPDDLIEQMEKIAYVHDISFNQLVVQCCTYSMEQLEEEKTEPLRKP